MEVKIVVIFILSTTCTAFPEGYHYNKPSNSFDLPTKPSLEVSTEAKGYRYDVPKIPFEENNLIVTPSKSGYKYPKPTVDFTIPSEGLSISTQPSIRTTRTSPLYSNTASSTTIRRHTPTQPALIITSEPISSTVFVGSTYDYPKSTPAKSTLAKGYNYPKPTIGFTLPQRVIESSKATSFEIPSSPRPANPPPKAYLHPVTNTNPSLIPTREPISTGYNYPKPIKAFTLPPRIVESSQATSFVQSSSHRPTNPLPKPSLPSITNSLSTVTPTREPISTGYNYPKPTIGFPFPPSVVVPSQTTTLIQPSSPRPINPPPKPSLRPITNTGTPIEPTIQSINTGYKYPKPTIGLSFPPRVVVPSQSTTFFQPSSPRPTNPPPKPSLPPNPIQSTIPTRESSVTGYNYPKPTVGFTFPPRVIEPSQATSSVQPNSPSPTNPSPKPSLPSVTSINVGYNYPKPTVKITFTPKHVVPTQTITSTPPTSPRPTNPAPKPSLPSITNTISFSKPTRETVAKGYNYPKPTIEFTFPSKVVAPSPTTIFSQPSSPRPTNPPPKPKIEVPSSTLLPYVPLTKKNPGYFYPKPTKDFTLPPPSFQPPNPPPPKPSIETIPTQATISREYSTRPSPTSTLFVTTTSKPVYIEPVTYPTRLPVITTSAAVETSVKPTGYNYSRPQIEFSLPTPAASEVTFAKQTETFNGYHYSSPSIPFIS